MPTLSRRNNSPHVRRALVYFGLMTLLVALPAPAGFLIDIQTTFLLKNQMSATPMQVSMFRVLTAFPVYLGFVFGLIRDRWDPLGLRDRGYFLIFAPVAAIAFVWLAFSGLSYRGLLVGMLGVMVVFGFLGAAYQGLMALLAQERLMSGRLSALSNVVRTVPGVVACFASGYISNHLRPQSTFILVAALSACIGLYCVIATTVVYALILPLIPLVPKELIATADGEPNPGVEAVLLKQVAGAEPVLHVVSGIRPEPLLPLERFSGWCSVIGVVCFQVPPVPPPAVSGAPVRFRR